MKENQKTVRFLKYK